MRPIAHKKIKKKRNSKSGMNEFENASQESAGRASSNQRYFTPDRLSRSSGSHYFSKGYSTWNAFGAVLKLTESKKVKKNLTASP